MRVMINGTAAELPEGATVAQAVRTLTEAAAGNTAGKGSAATATMTGIAVAVNDEVVSRGAWETTPLAEADRVEVLTAVQGG